MSLNHKYMHDFDTLKDKFTYSPILQTSNWNLSFKIVCDANDCLLGAMFGQKVDNKLHAIYYASRILNVAQANYSTTEKEFLSIIFHLEIFHSYII